MRGILCAAAIALSGCGETAKMLAGPPTGILAGWYCFSSDAGGKHASECLDTKGECDTKRESGGDPKATPCVASQAAWCYLDGDEGLAECALHQADCAAPAGATCTERRKHGFSCWTGKDKGGEDASACLLFEDECRARAKDAADQGTTAGPCAHRGSAYCIGDSANSCYVEDRECEDARTPGTDDGCLPTPR